MHVYICLSHHFLQLTFTSSKSLSLANPNIKDITDRTPLDYASEKKLNYCALLLSNAQQSGEVVSVVYTTIVCVFY